MLFTDQTRSRLEWAGLIIAVAALGAGLVYALDHWPLSLDSLGWGWLLAVLLVGVPLNTVANAYRFSLSFRLTGQRRDPKFLLRASVLTSAANMLPLPGGVLLRIAYLRGSDVGLTRATGITLAVAGVWFSLASLATGIALITLQRLGLGSVFGFAGILLAAGAWIYLSKLPQGQEVLIRLLVLETCVFATQAVRFSWCFLAIGYNAQWVQGLALSVAYVSGAVVSVIPAGLGVHELAAVLIAPFAQLDPSATLIAVFLDRIATMLGLILAASCLLIRRDSVVVQPR